MPMSRRFTEEEAQRIFARVAERQRETASAADGSLTLADLEEAASAAGLDPGLVVAAAAELDAAPHPEKTLAGVPTEIVRHRVLPGAIDDDTWAQVVSAARREFGQPGMAGQIGRLREWTCISGETKHQAITRLTAEPTADGTRITLSRSVQKAVLGFTIASFVQWGMAALFGTLALAGVDPALWIPAAILASLGVLFGAGTQVGARLWYRREAARFDGLLDRMELTAYDAERAAAPAAPAARSSEPADRLDLDALADDLDMTGSTSADRGRQRA